MTYWCPHRISVEVVGPSSRLGRTLERPYALIGSRSGSDIRLSSEEIAARGFYLHATEDGVCCVDLRRSAATSRSAPRALQPTERVATDTFSFRAWLDRSDAAAPSIPSVSPLPAVASSLIPELKIYHKGRCLGRRKLRNPLSLAGRWSNCDLQLKGPRVSGVHCSLYWQEGRLWCIDLGSSNGLVFQGQLLTCAELSPGDQIQVGDFEVAFDRLSHFSGKRQTRQHAAGSGSSARTSLKVEQLTSVTANMLHVAVSPDNQGRSLSQVTLELSRVRIESAVLTDHSVELAAARIGPTGQGALHGASGPPADEAYKASHRLNGSKRATKPPIAACGSPPVEAKWSALTELPPGIGSVLANALVASSERMSNPDTLPDVHPNEDQRMTGPVSTCADPANSASDSSSLTCTEDQRGIDVAVDGNAMESREATEALEPGTVTVSVDGYRAAQSGSEVDSYSAATRTGEEGFGKSRRSSPPVRVARDELVEYVTDRMVGLEQKRNRRRLWIGAGAALSLVVALLMVGGVWLRFGQEFLPMPPALMQQLPEPITAWLLSIGVSP